MQPKLGESSGDLGGGYSLMIVNGQVGISVPNAGDVVIPEYSVIVCTIDDDYFFIASAFGPQSPNAKIWRFDLQAQEHTQYVVANDESQIMSHIHQYSPGVRNIDPYRLTGDGQFITNAFLTVGVALLAVFVFICLVEGLITLLERKGLL
ncbi:MAG: hypothetical protein HRU13_06590 [Phycisphaerales bacterium]|nr:hypothetical protein [Phycisphaerales bacterium]